MHSFFVSCAESSWHATMSSSKEIDGKVAGRKQYEVNIRSVMAFREFGKDYSAIETFCAVMNMPPPMTNKNVYAINSKLHGVYTSSAKCSLAKAATQTDSFRKLYGRY